MVVSFEVCQKCISLRKCGLHKTLLPSTVFIYLISFNFIYSTIVLISSWLILFTKVK